MLEASGADFDTVIFSSGNERELGLRIGFEAHSLEKATEIVKLHDGFDLSAAGRGMMKEIEEEGGETAEMLEELSEMVGEDFMSSTLPIITGEDEPPVSNDDYQEALTKKEGSATNLIDLVVGYHDYLRLNLAEAYGEDDEDVDEEAWTATWKKLKDILGGEQGTLLATTAGFFDGLVREEFGDRFRAMEEDRGTAVNSDVCARVFYKVMQDHVPRAILGANRDEWTGYK